MEEFVKVTPDKKLILAELDTLKPHEKMEIIADQNGKPGAWIINRFSRKVLIEGVIQYVKFKS